MDAPFSSTQKRQITDQLEAISNQSSFSGAPRLLRLLRYLVENEIAGAGDQLNQMRIAMEVMDRGIEFDPSVDSVVRVEAGRLRSKLRDYYASEGSGDRVRFELPKGRYNPHITLEGEGGAPPAGGGVVDQEIRFLKTGDETTIAYSISGEGYPLVKAANWLSHLEYDHVSPVWVHWWRELGGMGQLVRYDERGCGLSDWEVDDFSVPVWVDDLERVVDTVGVEKFALLGISQGAAVAIDYAVRHPERVGHLILYGGFAQGRLVRPHSPEQAEEVEVMRGLIRLGWGMDNPAFRKTFASLFIPDATKAQIDAFDALQRMSTSPENAARFFDAFNHVDVLDIAPEVTVPTTVLHARGDVEIPFEQSRLMASTIPGARLVSLESNNHILGEDEPAWQVFAGEIRRILRSLS